jgi:transposase-like protein
MIALLSRPFCPCDGRRVSLRYLSAGLRYTTDHRGVKRITRPMLGFKAFDAAQSTLIGIELMHMIKKRQLVVEEGDEGRTAAELFYSLAA